MVHSYIKSIKSNLQVRIKYTVRIANERKSEITVYDYTQHNF